MLCLVVTLEAVEFFDHQDREDRSPRPGGG